MHQKCIRNLSQIQPSLPRSQSLKYYKNQNKHTYFFLYYLYLSQIYPKFNLLSLDLSHSITIKIKTSTHISSYITYIYANVLGQMSQDVCFRTIYPGT